MIIRLLERAPLSQEDWHVIRNDLLVVGGKLRALRKLHAITEEEYVLCYDRLKRVEDILNNRRHDKCERRGSR